MTKLKLTPEELEFKYKTPKLLAISELLVVVIMGSMAGILLMDNYDIPFLLAFLYVLCVANTVQGIHFTLIEKPFIKSQFDAHHIKLLEKLREVDSVVITPDKE